MSSSSGAAYGTGAASVVIGGWSLNEWAIAVGIACTVGTFLVNWYYKRQEFRLMQLQAHITSEDS